MPMQLAKFRARFVAAFAEELGRWSARTMIGATIAILVGIATG